MPSEQQCLAVVPSAAEESAYESDHECGGVLTPILNYNPEHGPALRRVYFD